METFYSMSQDFQPKVLVITLYSGENELEANKRSVKMQDIARTSQTIIEGLGNVEAHDELHKIIERRRDEFDFFVKLDADMVFERETSLRTLLEVFSDSELDHIIAPVYDIPSQTSIHGIHLFRTGVYWQNRLDKLFPDPSPITNGHRRILGLNTKTEVSHMPDPSCEQSFLFGYHRALKIAQRDRLIKDTANARNQICLLQKVENANSTSTCKSRRLILLGADTALRGNSSLIKNKESYMAKLALNDTLDRLLEHYPAKPQHTWWWLMIRHVRIPALWSHPMKTMISIFYRIYVTHQGVIKRRRIIRH